MSIQTTITCDNCGTVKGKTNHWYIVSIFKEYEPCLQVQPFNYGTIEDFEGTYELSVLCCEACTMKFVSENLSKLHDTPATEPK